MLSNHPLVSIITPTYNHERFIAQCIESVLAQTYPHWEMLIVDDGSTDKTAAIVKRYRDPRIRYFYQEHKGPFRLGETYNFALRQSQGELIAILEGDDWWPPDKLEKMVPLFANPKVVLAHGASDWVAWAASGRCLEVPQDPALTFPLEILENCPVGLALKIFLQTYNFITAVTVMLRKSALHKVGGFKQEPYLPLVDFTTWLHLALVGEFAYHPYPSGYWRKTPGSITMSYSREILKGFERAVCAFIDSHAKLLLELGFDPAKYRAKAVNLTSKRLKTLYEDKAAWAEFFLQLGEWQVAREIYLRNLPSLRTPVGLVLAVTGLSSTFCRINLVSPLRKTYQCTKRALGLKRKPLF